MQKLIPILVTCSCLTGWGQAIAGGTAADRPVVPCDQPGANPGGTTALDHTTEPCNVGMPNDIGNTTVTGLTAPGDARMPNRSETKRQPPPHNPNPQPVPGDK